MSVDKSDVLLLPPLSRMLNLAKRSLSKNGLLQQPGFRWFQTVSKCGRHERGPFTTIMLGLSDGLISLPDYALKITT